MKEAMTKLILPEKEEETTVVPFLTAIEGGKPENWLKNLAEGTIFFCRQRGDSKSIDVIEYHVMFHFEKITVLHSNFGEKEFDMRVDSLRFSRAMELIEVGFTPEEETDG